MAMGEGEHPSRGRAKPSPGPPGLPRRGGFPIDTYPCQMAMGEGEKLAQGRAKPSPEPPGCRGATASQRTPPPVSPDPRIAAAASERMPPPVRPIRAAGRGSAPRPRGPSSAPRGRTSRRSPRRGRARGSRPRGRRVSTGASGPGSHDGRLGSRPVTTLPSGAVCRSLNWRGLLLAGAPCSTSPPVPATKRPGAAENLARGRDRSAPEPQPAVARAPPGESRPPRRAASRPADTGLPPAGGDAPPRGDAAVARGTGLPRPGVAAQDGPTGLGPLSRVVECARGSAAAIGARMPGAGGTV